MSNLITLVNYYKNNKKLDLLTITEQIDVLTSERIIANNKLNAILREDVSAQISSLTNQRQQLVVRRDQLTSQLNRQIEMLDKQLAQLRQTQSNNATAAAQQQQQQNNQPQNTGSSGLSLT